jgi:uncharacterized phage infection (PIP) family protein YhgE
MEDVDALYKLPLAEFTSARNALASRLKKAGRADEAQRVKDLAKPPISAWAVNQLYWNHRKEFDKLVASGSGLLRAHGRQISGKSGEVREALAARREALSVLSHLAEGVLRNAGHNPTPDTMRRIETTLEALSANTASNMTPGRLSADAGPPGFESLAALIPSIPSPPPPEESRLVPFSRPAAKAALKAAEQSLTEKRARLKQLNAALKQASAHSADAEKRLREATEAAQQARELEHGLANEVKNAAKEVEEAERAVEKARQ